MDLTAFCSFPLKRKTITKTLMIMKLLAVFLLGSFLQLSATGNAQKVTLSEKNAPLQKIFRQVHRQTGYQFFYEDALLDKAGKVNIQVKDVSLEEVLNQCFKNLPLKYEVINKTIVVSSNPLPIAGENVTAPLPPPITVRGIVRNESGELLPGISIMVKGTTKGTVAGVNGVFLLEGVEENAILIFSGVNQETQEIALAGRTSLVVTLKTIISPLDEIQIIGYGQTTRRLKTGSVGTLKSDVISKQLVTNPAQALQGRVAGVAVTQTQGSIGSGSEIQIRGVGTIAAGNQPLIIVDGAIMPDANNGLGTALGGYMTFGSTSLNVLNPADIESMEILKDADATAIYGSRGANGVILITTKKAKLGITRFNIDVSTWSNSAAYLPSRLGLPEYLQMRRDAFAMGNHNPTTGVAITPIPLTTSRAPDLLVWDTTKATADWTDYEYGNRAPAYNVQANLSGGEKRLNFYSSAGYQKQGDITRGSPYQERLSASLSVNHTSANDRLRIALNTSYLINRLFPSRGGGIGGSLASLPPNMPIMNPDGTPFWPPGTIQQNTLLLNPLATEEASTTSKTNSFIGNIDLNYRIYKGLSFKTLMGYNIQEGNVEQKTPSTSINPLIPGSTVPNSRTVLSTYKSFNFEPQLSYNSKLGGGKLDVLVGSTFFDKQQTSYALSLDGYTNDLLLGSWAAATNVTSRTNTSANYRFNSIFGRVNYNWENKYLVNLTYRRDGSSRFGPKRQFGDFGAVGLGWIFTKEKWMQDVVPGLSYGKLRGSYGTTGNDNISNYQYTTLFSPNVYNGQSGLSSSYLSDSSVSWETSKKLDLALELGFLNDRILFTTNWYRTLSTDLLVSTPVPAQTGFTSFITNIPAVVENKGWEFELTTKNFGPKSKLQWNTSFNLNLLKNSLLEFPGLEQSTYATRLKIGLPVNSPRNFLNAEWSQIYEGVDPATGLPIFKDLNNDGLINNNDRTYIGSAIPRTFGGLGNTLSYKGFELDVFFQFSQQLTTNWMFNNLYPGQLNNPVSDVYGNYWKQPGDVTKYPRLWTGVATNTTTNLLSNIYPFSSATLVDMMYVRLKNLSLSYSLPTELLSKAKLNKAVVYLRGQNLLTWTSKEILKDPELITLRGGSAILKTISVGLQLSF